MKATAIVLLSVLGFVAAGSDMFGMHAKMKKWTKMKAMEGCYGEKVTQDFMVKWKRAGAKCMGSEAPELDLPMFRSPYRMVQSLLMGAKDTEKANLMKLAQHMESKQKMTQMGSMGGMQNVAYIPYPVMQQQSPKQDGGDQFMMKMLKKMMMKKMMKKMMDDDSFGNPMEKDDERDFGDFYLSMGMEGDEEDFGLGDFFKILATAQKTARRTKRDAELFDLGDKLNEKLSAMQETMKMKLGNMSCIFEEMNIIDKDMNLNLVGMNKQIDNMGLTDEWFIKANKNMHNKCYALAEALPREYLKDCFSEKWGKIKMFFHCCEMQKIQNCMKYDIKKKLEQNFKPLPELIEETGMEEKILLPLAHKLISSEFDM